MQMTVLVAFSGLGMECGARLRRRRHRRSHLRHGYAVGYRACVDRVCIQWVLMRDDSHDCGCCGPCGCCYIFPELTIVFWYSFGLIFEDVCVLHRSQILVNSECNNLAAQSLPVPQQAGHDRARFVPVVPTSEGQSTRDEGYLFCPTFFFGHRPNFVYCDHSMEVN